MTTVNARPPTAASRRVLRVAGELARRRSTGEPRTSSAATERANAVLVVRPATQDMTFRQFTDGLKRLRAASEHAGVREVRIQQQTE